MAENDKTTDAVDSTKPGVLVEGQAEILLEKNVFYNPVQEFNRDLSISVLNLCAGHARQKSQDKVKKHSEPADTTETENQDGMTILEALSATGLRSIRYAKEVSYVKQIVANDISARAVESIKKNIAHNGVEDLVTASHDDAIMLMYQRRKNGFHAVDLDPYGCPSIFLDAAVQCVTNGGLLMVTATDMAVLAGNSPETCYVKYGAVSLKSKCCHEMALRILLQHIAMHAGRHGRYIVPLLSISVDFYIRVFVTVHTGQLQCKNNTSQLGMVYQCNGCESMTTQPLGLKKSETSYKLPNGPPVDRLCKFCNHSHHIGGPIWLGLIHDKTFVADLLNVVHQSKLGTRKRMLGVLNVVMEELDVPLYYALDRLMSLVRCQTPPMVMFRSALLNAGYNVTYSHANKASIKTDAPNDVIWDIVRAWEKNQPSKRDKMAKGSPSLAILEAPMNTEIKFDLHPEANPQSRRIHLARFQVNPTRNWGPGARSTTIVSPHDGISKRKRNQNKNAKHRKNKREDETPPSEADQTDKIILGERTTSEYDKNDKENDAIGASQDATSMEFEQNEDAEKEKEKSHNEEDSERQDPLSKRPKIEAAAAVPNV